MGLYAWMGAWKGKKTGKQFILGRKNRYCKILVQMQCYLSPDRSDIVIGQLVSLEVVQRSERRNAFFGTSG
jgi:hypothetical protein